MKAFKRNGEWDSMIKTVTGDISEKDVGIVLPHEHICCYSEYLYAMKGDKYICKDKLFEYSCEYLKELKEKYNLKTFIDCTPINIGRDIDLLKRISNETGLNIISSTGFYFIEEAILFKTPVDDITDAIITDAVNTNAGIIKCATEKQEITPYIEKILRACARAQLKLNLPIVMHTNARNKNGIKALEILLEEGVDPKAITVGHLSDTDDVEYIKYFADKGCFIGLDRIRLNTSDEYVQKMVDIINSLAEDGLGDKILLSHDSLFFNGFKGEDMYFTPPRLSFSFDYIIPKLDNELQKKIMIDNPLRMLTAV